MALSAVQSEEIFSYLKITTERQYTYQFILMAQYMYFNITNQTFLGAILHKGS